MWGMGRTQSGKVQTGVDFFLFLNAMPSSRPMGKPLSWRVASVGGERMGGNRKGLNYSCRQRDAGGPSRGLARAK